MGFQDFAIAHELLHLRVPNRGKLFKALMTAHVPDLEEVRSRKASLYLRRRLISSQRPPAEESFPQVLVGQAGIDLRRRNAAVPK